MTFLHGHRVGSRIFEFPHFCPGDECAIADWCFQKVYRLEGTRALGRIEAVPAAPVAPGAEGDLPGLTPSERGGE
jgi:hypothetical protein